MSTKKVLFEPWKDPLLAKDFDQDEDEEAGDSPDEFEPTRKLFRKNSKIITYNGRLFMSPIGILPLGEHNLPSETFNMWIMHTNFPITTNAFDVLETVPGVEFLMGFSPYRLWLGLGRLFDTEEVHNAIRNELCSEFPSEVVKNLVNQARRKEYPAWAITASRGRLNLISGQNEVEVTDKMDKNMRLIKTSWKDS